MSHLRGLAIVIASIILLTGTIGAQDKDKEKDRDNEVPPARGVLPANWGKIGLEQEQKNKIYKIQADYKAKIEPLENQLRELRAKEKTELEAVLTDQQKAKYKEIILSRPLEKPEGKKPEDKKP